VGGPATVFRAASIDVLREVVAFCRSKEIDHYILGKGSNVLFSDRGYAGVILSMADLAGYRVSGTRIIAEAGAPLGTLIAVAHAHGSHGLDFLAGIPGTLGGAVTLNAGITEAEIGEIIENVGVIDIAGDVTHIGRDRCEFAYRSSSFLTSRIPIVDACLRLDGSEYDLRRLLALRRATQPLAFPSAGCTFKNPPGFSAGELIDRAGLKGFRVGMAKVSDKHANFILNLGGATSAEIRKLIDIVRQKVYKSFRIPLELEIEVVDG